MLSVCETLAGESGSRGGRREQTTQFLLPPPRAAAIHALLLSQQTVWGKHERKRPETTWGKRRPTRTALNKNIMKYF